MMSILLKSDHLPKDEYKVELNTDEVDNPRLKLNVPATKMLIEVTDTTPPLLVLVCRADLEVSAFGLLEKAKDMVRATQLKTNSKLVTKGISEAAALLDQGRPH